MLPLSNLVPLFLKPLSSITSPIWSPQAALHTHMAGRCARQISLGLQVALFCLWNYLQMKLVWLQCQLTITGSTVCSSPAPTPFLCSSWGFATQEWPGGTRTLTHGYQTNILTLSRHYINIIKILHNWFVMLYFLWQTVVFLSMKNLSFDEQYLALINSKVEEAFECSREESSSSWEQFKQSSYFISN